LDIFLLQGIAELAYLCHLVAIGFPQLDRIDLEQLSLFLQILHIKPLLLQPADFLLQLLDGLLLLLQLKADVLFEVVELHAEESNFIHLQLLRGEADDLGLAPRQVEPHLELDGSIRCHSQLVEEVN
jgi:hypothetical protein